MHHIVAALAFAVLVECTHAQTLPTEINDTRWNVSSTVFGNFTCRGQQDMAMFGVSEKTGFVVMIQPVFKGALPNYLIFATRSGEKSNLRLKIESLDFARSTAFKEELKVVAPGLVPSKTCKGLAFGDGETDSHHIYWDRSKKEFRAWSL